MQSAGRWLQTRWLACALAACLVAWVVAAPETAGAGVQRASPEDRAAASSPADARADSRTSSPTARGDDRPSSARRFVRVFDFEDPGNPDPVPVGWVRAQEDPTPVADPSGAVDRDGQPRLVPRAPREGFPSHNRSAYDFGVAASGRASIKVPARGGSASLRLEAGEVPVFADADYAVSARVRTRGLRQGGAFISARLLDGSLHPIAASETRSAPVADADGTGWTTVTVELPGRFEAAAWLQIDLEVLQPRRFRPASAQADHQVWLEDLDGAAWFDDVLVYLQPRAHVRTTSPSNITIGGSGPRVEAAVRDLGGDALTGWLKITDLHGRMVAETSFAIDPSGLPSVWEPVLPGFGWYTVHLDVRTDAELVRAGRGERGVPVATEALPIVWMPSWTPLPAPSAAITPSSDPQHGTGYSDDLTRFGLVADGSQAENADLLAQALERSGTRFLVLPITGAETRLAHARAELDARAPAIERMLAAGHELTFCIPGAPEELAREANLDSADPLSLADRPAADWFGYYQPLLDRFGQRVVRYQMGASGSDVLFWNDRLASGLGVLEEQLSTLVPGPQISAAWSADRARPVLARPDRDQAIQTKGQPSPAVAASSLEERLARIRVPEGPLVDGVMLAFPASFPASQVGRVLEQWTRADDLGQTPEITLLIDLERGSGDEHAASVRELSRRVINWWATLDHGRSNARGARTRAAIACPWDSVDAGAGSIAPRPAWPVFAQLSRMLAGRRILGSFPALPGVTSFILAEHDERTGELLRGGLVVWNESAVGGGSARAIAGAAPSPVRLDVGALGDKIEVVDVFGNRRGLSDSERASGIEIGQTPIFIEGVNAYVALFVSGFKIEPGFVPSVVAEHEHELVLTNPWPIRISGTFQVREGEAIAGGTRRSGWNITPAGVVEFSIGPGQSERLPLTFSFGPGQLAGRKTLRVLARITADREYPLLRLESQLEVGLRELRLELDAARLPNQDGPDVAVMASITNTGTRTRSLRLEAATSDHPTQQLQVSDLGPGQTVLRRFVFRGVDAGASGAGQIALVSLSDLEDAQRLNKAVVLP